MKSWEPQAIGSRAMEITRNKWSARAEYFQLFLMCAFPIHVWAYINLLNDMPAIQLQMGFWRILGVAAYVLDFALLESLFVFGLIFIVSFILPERLFELKLVQIESIIVLTTSISVIFIQLYDHWEINSLTYADWIALWALIGLSIFIIAAYWLNRNQRAQVIFQSGVERLAILSLVYISLDILGLIVIIIRNFIGYL
jgi:hypothetical protein